MSGNTKATPAAHFSVLNGLSAGISAPKTQPTRGGPGLLATAGCCSINYKSLFHWFCVLPAPGELERGHLHQVAKWGSERKAAEMLSQCSVAAVPEALPSNVFLPKSLS